MILPREGEAYVLSRCGGGREKLHKGGRHGSNNCIEKQLVLSEPENVIRIQIGGISFGQGDHGRKTWF